MEMSIFNWLTVQMIFIIIQVAALVGFCIALAFTMWDKSAKRFDLELISVVIFNVVVFAINLWVFSKWTHILYD